MRPTRSGGPRIAFFGGSFDPPHLGHIAVARAAREALGLDCVLFAPVGTQPLKPAGPTAGFDDRVAMTRLAIEGEAGFALSLVDAPRPDGVPNYTLDTLERLREELPAGSALYCLMGADSLAGLRKWHRGEEIPFSAPLIVASRPGQALDNLKRRMTARGMLRDRGLRSGAIGLRTWRDGGRPSIYCRGWTWRSARQKFERRFGRGLARGRARPSVGS
jgi:nicotinate-nucleotide adenylyltransferase